MADILDKFIADVGYIYDSLLTLKQIEESGNCYTCANATTCWPKPDGGKVMRYNCPHWLKGENNDY